MATFRSRSGKPAHAIALVGNPGTGKSTILNGLVGSPHFRSGMSYGAGLTQRLQEYVMDGVSYFDNPGLNDIEKRKEAGAEIDKLLRSNVSIKLVFVVTVLNGRVQPQDAATIGLVLDAITSVDTNDQFGVIINQVSKTFVDKMHDDPFTERMVMEQLTGARSTSHWCYVMSDERLAGAEGGMLMNNDLQRLFETVPATRPVSATVSDIDTESYEEKLARELEAFSAKEEALKQQLQMQQERVEKLNSLMNDLMDSYTMEREENAERQKQMEKEQEELKQQVLTQNAEIEHERRDARRHRKDVKRVEDEAKRKREALERKLEDLKQRQQRARERARNNEAELNGRIDHLENQNANATLGIYGSVAAAAVPIVLKMLRFL